MARSLAAVIISFFLLASLGNTQQSQVTFGGVQTVALTTPTVAPTFTEVCSGSMMNYTYEYVAVDASGGVTGPSPTNTAAPGCATLGSGNLNIVFIPAISGSTSCIVYRVTPSTELVGSVPCGGAIVDASTGTTGLSPANGNSTGGVKATGTVSGQNFLASGTGAGTSDWVNGGPLSLCSTSQPQPCIQINSFFIQAAQAIGTSFGWTSPAAANSAAVALILGPSGGTPPTSSLTFGALTDTTVAGSQPTLATVTGTLNANHLVSLSNPSGSNYDLIDSGISNANGAGLIASGNNVSMSSSYAVTSSAVTLPGLTWSLPVLAKAWSFNCNLAYSTTSTSSKLELWVDAQQTPQYLVATAEIYVNTAAAAGAYTTASVTPTASGASQC